MKVDIIYNENTLTGLKKLPDDCIDTIITSPPYWGLRNYGDVWTIPTQPFPEALNNSKGKNPGDVWTILKVAKQLGRHYIGIEIKKEYVEMARKRLRKTVYQKEFGLG